MSALSEPVNRSENIFKCADRVSPGDDPRDITFIKEHYLPLDVSHKTTHIRKNPFGAVIYRTEVQAGNIYPSFDGKRLVLEVGCNTVIYILINMQLPSQHHRVFIQSETGFSADTTIRRDAAEIVENTRHVETIVKYEMYFIMGALSTLSISAWLAVTGSDVTYLYSRKRMVADAAKRLARSVLNELGEIESYAPVFHQKIWELIISEARVVSEKSVSDAPKNAVKSEKVQAQVAGVVFGKWSIPGTNPFNAWALIMTLFGQAAIKSGLAYPDTVMQVLDQRYKPLADQMKNVDVSQPSSLVRPAQTMVGLLQENGVSISVEEVSAIIREIRTNPEKAYMNIQRIVVAVNEFRRMVNQ